MRRLPSLACAVALCISVSVACSDDGGGGATSSGGGETGDAGGGPGPIGDCEPESEAETIVADIGAPTTWFAAGEEGVAYVTRAI